MFVAYEFEKNQFFFLTQYLEYLKLIQINMGS